MKSGRIATVECHSQVRSWRLLRTIMELLIPTCNCIFVQESDDNSTYYKPRNSSIYSRPNSTNSPSPPCSRIFTGTIFGCKRGKVKFCIQQSNNPILLIELAVPTSVIAQEMRGGLLRIALECTKTEGVWRMYCNGRRVGFAVKRRASKADMEVLKRISSVVVGAGVVRGEEIGDDDVIYMRGNFERVGGSSHAESFHFIDPDGNTNQDLSIFFLRSS